MNIEYMNIAAFRRTHENRTLSSNRYYSTSGFKPTFEVATNRNNSYQNSNQFRIKADSSKHSKRILKPIKQIISKRRGKEVGRMEINGRTAVVFKRRKVLRSKFASSRPGQLQTPPSTDYNSKSGRQPSEPSDPAPLGLTWLWPPSTMEWSRMNFSLFDSQFMTKAG